MSSKPSVAVCIPTFNQAAFLPLAVRSACAQTYPGVEVWVADDASTDDTPKVMAELCQEYRQINYYRQQLNCGIAENNSWLLPQPETDYVVRLDSDDIMEPKYVERLVYFMEQYPLAGYAHVAIQQIDSEGRFGQQTHLARATGYVDGDTALRASLTDYKVAANIVMFRKKVLEELNFYRGRPEFVEDYDLSVRVADAGYGNVYVDEVLAQYRVWADTGNKRLKRKNLQLTGYKRIYEESMKPAYARRGWSTATIDRQMRKMALHHSAYCFSDFFSSAERESLAKLLILLGDSPMLRLKLAALKAGCGPLFRWQEKSEKALRQYVKLIISSLRSSRHEGTQVN